MSMSQTKNIPLHSDLCVFFYCRSGPINISWISTGHIHILHDVTGPVLHSTKVFNSVFILIPSQFASMPLAENKELLKLIKCHYPLLLVILKSKPSILLLTVISLNNLFLTRGTWTTGSIQLLHREYSVVVF